MFRIIEGILCSFRLYPTNASLEECGLDVNSYPWFKMMIGFRNYSNGELLTFVKKCLQFFKA